MTAQGEDHDLLIEIKTMLAGVLHRDEDKEARLRLLESYGLKDISPRVAVLERAHWRRIGIASLGSSLVSSGLVAGLIELMQR